MPTPQETRIEELAQVVEQRRNQAEEAAVRFMSVVTSTLQDRIRERIPKVVTGEPEQAVKLGTAGLKSMKDELAALTADMFGYVRSWLGSDALWPHRRKAPLPQLPIEYRPPPQTMATGPKEFSEAIVKNLDALLRDGLLRKYGFQGKMGDFFFWFEWTTPVKDALRAYATAYDVLGMATVSLGQAIHAKAAAEAQSLWDQA